LSTLVIADLYNSAASVLRRLEIFGRIDEKGACETFPSQGFGSPLNLKPAFESRFVCFYAYATRRDQTPLSQTNLIRPTTCPQARKTACLSLKAEPQGCRGGEAMRRIEAMPLNTGVRVATEQFY
jgi:hypothetical protein